MKFFFSPVTYLVCTQMRVMTENPSRTVYLTTSNESQIFIKGNLNYFQFYVVLMLLLWKEYFHFTAQ